MKTYVLTGIGILVAACVLFGANSVRVARDRVVDGAHELLPSGFRKAVAEKDLEGAERQLAEAAAAVDLEILPMYSELLPGMTFAKLQEQNLRPFRNMATDLEAGSGVLAAKMCCVSGSEHALLAEKKAKLEQLAQRARRDLEFLESLQAQFAELSRVRDELRQVSATDSLPAIDMDEDSLASVRSYIAERNRDAVAARYRSSLQHGSPDLSSSEMAEVRDLLKTLDVASR